MNQTDLRALLKRELAPGEQLLWSGHPDPDAMFRHARAIWRFAIVWTVFSLGWEAGALHGWLHGRAPLLFPLFGLPFVMIGIALFITPWRAARTARQKIYAVTSQRLIELTAARNLQVMSIGPMQIGPVSREQSPDGTGSLKIVLHIKRDSDGDLNATTFDFIGIPNVAHVERLVHDLRNRQADVAAAKAV